MLNQKEDYPLGLYFRLSPENVRKFVCGIIANYEQVNERLKSLSLYERLGCLDLSLYIAGILTVIGKDELVFNSKDEENALYMSIEASRSCNTAPTQWIGERPLIQFDELDKYVRDAVLNSFDLTKVISETEFARASKEVFGKILPYKEMSNQRNIVGIWNKGLIRILPMMDKKAEGTLMIPLATHKLSNGKLFLQVL